MTRFKNILCFTILIMLSIATNILAQESPMHFPAVLGDKISLWDNRLGAGNMYGFGIEASTLYFKSQQNYRWYINRNANGGNNDVMQLTSSGLDLMNGRLHVNKFNGTNQIASLRVWGTGSQGEGLGGSLVSGNADAASFGSYNLGIESWYGIGFKSSFGDKKARIVFNTRNGSSFFEGKMGIGTDTPNDKLEVRAPNRQLRLTDSDDNKFWQFSASSNALALRFQEGTSEEKLAWWANSNGYVGIGLINPTTNLDISMPSAESALRIRSGNGNTSFTKSQIAFSYNNNATYSHAIKTRHNGGSLDRNSIDFYVWQPGDDVNGIGTKHVMSLNGGKVGIGTNDPDNLLDIESTSNPTLRVKHSNEQDSWGLFISQKDDLTGSIEMQGRNLQIGAGWNGKVILGLPQFEAHGGRVVIPWGKVGIGTQDPKNKLSVNGTIWAKKVKVTLVDAADWVFEEDYELRSLEEVEAHITKYKHLPDMPSAEEFRENDLDIAEMDNRLLQKIEELTLYLIEQNKDIQLLKKENQELKKLINSKE